MSAPIQKHQIKQRESLFTKSTNYFLDYLGLQSWEVYIESQIKDKVRASCYWDLIGRTATICWSLDWINEKSLSDKEICKVAFHECCELYLASLYDCMKDYKGHNHAQEQVHIPIRLLENKLFPVVYKQLTKDIKK